MTTFGYISVGLAIGLSLIIMLVVAIGAGVERYKHSKVSRKLANTVRHLNGEAAPPAGLVTFFEELPGSARSAFSARSAASATERVPTKNR